MTDFAILYTDNDVTNPTCLLVDLRCNPDVAANSPILYPLLTGISGAACSNVASIES